MISFSLCSATSATSHVVLGQFKTCVILLGGYVFFNSDPGFVSICGALAALCGMSVYTSLNLQKSSDVSGKPIPKQTLLAKANGEEKTDVEEELLSAAV